MSEDILKHRNRRERDSSHIFLMIRDKNWSRLDDFSAVAHARYIGRSAHLSNL